MNYPDYKVQVLRERRQWASGLLCKLALDDSGVGLFASPSFQGWLSIGEQEDWPTSQGNAIASDECGQILWIDCRQRRKHASPDSYCRLRIHNRDTDSTETLLDLDPRLAGAGAPIKPARLWVGETGLWVFDKANSRLLGFSRDSFQLFRVIKLEGQLLDVAFDKHDTFYALVHSHNEYWIARYDSRFERGGQLSPWRCRNKSGETLWIKPIKLAVSERWLWLLDEGADDRPPQFVRLKLECDSDGAPKADPCSEPRGVRDEDPLCQIIPIPRKRETKCDKTQDDGLDANLIPEQIAVDCQNNLLVVFKDKEGRSRLFQFDPTGSFLGEIQLPTKPARSGKETARRRIREIRSIIPGLQDEIFLATDLGLARFTLEHVPISESGVYYLRTLDNGLEDGAWHRLALRAQLPAGAHVAVEGFASNQVALKESIDGIIDDAGLLPQQKKREIERRLGSSWKPVAQFTAPPVEELEGEAIQGEAAVPVARVASPVNLNHDALFVENRGRYLWLKLVLTSFDENARPAVRELRVFHPRQSYLRYLPATYQEAPGDPSSETVARDFLDRFLSLFESDLWALDVEIDRLFEYFDPCTTPSDFLPWLACWLNLALEEDWPEDRKRRLIENAWKLYETKGTASGLARLIEIVADAPVRIIEESSLIHPVPLDDNPEAGWRIGRNTFVRRGPARGFRVGDSSILGRVALRREAQDPTDPFTVSAYRFLVLVFGDPDRMRSAEPIIRRLIDEHKPAHTIYTLRLAAHGSIGRALRIGLNTRMVGGSPLRLGENTTLGHAITISRTPRRTRLGSASGLGRGFELN